MRNHFYSIIMTPAIVIDITPLHSNPLSTNPKSTILNRDLYWQLFCKCVEATHKEMAHLHFTLQEKDFLVFFGNPTYLKSARTLIELIRSSLIEGKGMSYLHFIYKDVGNCFLRIEHTPVKGVLFYDITAETSYPSNLIEIIIPALKKMGEDLKISISSENKSTMLVSSIKMVSEASATTIYRLSASRL